MLAGRTKPKLIYQDDGAMLYARSNSTATRIPGKGRAQELVFP